MNKQAYFFGGAKPRAEGGNTFIELYEDLELAAFSPFGPTISMKLKPEQALKFAEQLTRLARTHMFGECK